MMAIAMITAFMVSLLFGLPLFLYLLPTALVELLFADPALLADTLPQYFFGGMDIFSLMAIPLFVLAGSPMNHSGMTPRLTHLANALVSHFRGDLGHVNMVAGVFFAGVSESVVTGTSVLSTLLVPAMKKKDCSWRFAIGLITDGSLIGPIIPLSIFTILHPSLANISVGKLFLAGIVPGLSLVAAFMLLDAAYAYRNGLQARHAAPAWGEILAALSGALAALIASVIIVAGIVLRLVAPIESGALIAFYVVLVDLLQRQLNLIELWSPPHETVRLTANIYVIIAVASVVNWLLNYARVTSELVRLLESFSHSPTLILFIISTVILVCGMLMEEVSILMLLTPIVIPVALAADVDPMYLGLIFALNITIALTTPPMGACLLIVATVSRLGILEVFKDIWPLILLALGVLSLLILFPSLTLQLPRLLN